MHRRIVLQLRPDLLVPSRGADEIIPLLSTWPDGPLRFPFGGEFIEMAHPVCGLLRQNLLVGLVAPTEHVAEILSDYGWLADTTALGEPNGNVCPG